MRANIQAGHDDRRLKREIAIAFEKAHDSTAAFVDDNVEVSSTVKIAGGAAVIVASQIPQADRISECPVAIPRQNLNVVAAILRAHDVELAVVIEIAGV